MTSTVETRGGPGLWIARGKSKPSFGRVMPSTLATPAAFRKAGLKETAVLLALAWFIPFAVHLLPWSGDRPLGAHLLPMFWAAFGAVYLYGARVGLLVGLFAPLLNLAITGLPAWQFMGVLSFELVVFVLVAAWAIPHASRLVVLAPLAYLAAKLASTGLQLATSVFGDIGAPGAFLAGSILGGLPGLLVLLVINAALVKMYPRTSSEVR